ncbi:MAG TPA: arylesterase [Marinobacterium sp.]|nr:arylesterase [Marinobacterium sp.]
MLRLLTSIVIATLTFTSLNSRADGILVLGDSLAAGYGLERGEGWVDLLQQRLDESGRTIELINASVSGETTSGGLSRLPDLLELHKPDMVLLELGANDGLRGIPLTIVEANLNKLVELVNATDASTIMLGNRLPPNYGPRYTQEFFELFQEVAAVHDLPLVPFLLDGVATDWDLMQADGLHPNAEAQPIILETVWQVLEPELVSE